MKKVTTATFAVAAIAALAAAGAIRAVQAAQDGEPGESFGKEKTILDTKELMELLFDPYYVDIRNAVEEPPESRSEWRSLYIGVFRLAEVNNLLFSRDDEAYMQEDDWTALSTEARDLTESLGEAVRAQDYELIRERYEAVIQSCNKCHDRFQQEPVEVKPFL